MMMPFWPWWIIPIQAEELKELEDKAEKLEAVREFVLSRKYDIEMDLENFGMLKPVLTYFLEETEG